MMAGSHSHFWRNIAVICCVAVVLAAMAALSPALSLGALVALLIWRRSDIIALAREDLRRHGELAAARPAAAERELERAIHQGGGAVLVRTYKGRTQADAASLFASEAAVLARKGFRPTSQSWGDGRPGAGRIIALGVLASSARPDGMLTVTYTRSRDGM